MDPNNMFSDLLDAILKGDTAAAGGHAEELAIWVSKGGHVPQALTDARVNQGPREVSIDDDRSQR